MKRITAAARRLYQPQLATGEDIVSVHRATAAGTGAKIFLGAAIGALVGWLVAISLDAALLPLLVLGALTGEIAGYVQAERAARRPTGPGTIHLDLVLTTASVLTLRRYGTRRDKVLRRYPLDQISSVVTRRYPVANYHRQELTMAGGAGTAFVVEGVLDIDPVNKGPTSG